MASRSTPISSGSRDPGPRRVAVILAAGQGKRLRSAGAKVLHPAAGRPLLAWVLDAAHGAGCEPILVVVGHGGAEVRAAFAGEGVVWVEQAEQRGTGHALAQAESYLDAAGAGDATLLVLSGDAPLVRAETLEALARRLEPAGDGGGVGAGGGASGVWGALAVADLAEPGTLGRVIAAPARSGEPEQLARIVEVADAGPAERGVRTVNAGFYAFRAPEIFAYLSRLALHNAQGELYLTDALVAAAAAGERVVLHRLADPDEALGVNTPDELEQVERALLARKAAERRPEAVVG